MKMYVGSCAHSGYLALVWFLEGWGSSAEEWKKSQNILLFSSVSFLFCIYVELCSADYQSECVDMNLSSPILYSFFVRIWKAENNRKKPKNRRRETSTAFPADKQRFHFHWVFFTAAAAMSCRVKLSYALRFYYTWRCSPTFIVFQIVCARWDVWLSFDVMWYVMFSLA